MRKKADLKQIKNKLYFLLAALLLTAVSISVYQSSIKPGDTITDRTHGQVHADQLPSGQSGIAGLASDQRLTDQIQPDQTGAGQVSSGQTDAARPDTLDTGEETDGGVQEASSIVAPVHAAYKLVVTDGYLQVYSVESDSLYMDTMIAYELLPEKVRRQIDQGKYFDTEETLLEFLESYSS